MNIEVHIESLVLHGCSPFDRERVAAAFAAELEQMLAERGGPWTPDRVDGRRLNANRAVSNGEPERQGRHIATAVYRMLAGAVSSGRHADEQS